MADHTRILIVDDDPIVADSLADLLGEEGYATTTAQDGQEALAVLQQTNGSGQVGIVITDMNMPRLDGFELLKNIRKLHASVVPIVITGFGFGFIEFTEQCASQNVVDERTFSGS